MSATTNVDVVLNILLCFMVFFAIEAAKTKTAAPAETSTSIKLAATSMPGGTQAAQKTECRVEVDAAGNVGVEGKRIGATSDAAALKKLAETVGKATRDKNARIAIRADKQVTGEMLIDVIGALGGLGKEIDFKRIKKETPK